MIQCLLGEGVGVWEQKKRRCPKWIHTSVEIHSQAIQDLGAGSVLGCQHGAEWTDTEQHGAKRIPKWPPEAVEMESKAKLLFHVEKMRQSAINKTKYNNVQKRSIRGHPHSFGVLGPDRLFGGTMLNNDTFGELLGAGNFFKVMEQKKTDRNLCLTF